MPLEKTYKWGTPSGVQILPVFYIPDHDPVLMGTVDTITYSTHRGKAPIRPLGLVNKAGTARGKRTIAGTIIFKIFDGLELKKILATLSDSYFNRSLPDELPPFNVVIVIPYVTDYGEVWGGNGEGPTPQIISLIGVEITDQAASVSIDDVETETTLAYTAQDIVDIRGGDTLGIFSTGGLISSFLPNSNMRSSTTTPGDLPIPQESNPNEVYPQEGYDAVIPPIAYYTTDDWSFGGASGGYYYYNMPIVNYDCTLIPSEWVPFIESITYSPLPREDAVWVVITANSPLS